MTTTPPLPWVKRRAMTQHFCHRPKTPAPKVSKLTWSVEVCVSPGADNSARPMSLASGGKQVIGALERDEASRVAGQAEDLARVLDAYRVVGRRVQD